MFNCIKSFDDYNNKKQEGNRYINKGTQKEETVLDFTVKSINNPNRINNTK